MILEPYWLKFHIKQLLYSVCIFQSHRWTQRCQPFKDITKQFPNYNSAYLVAIQQKGDIM
jgi:hypothetical protein